MKKIIFLLVLCLASQAPAATRSVQTTTESQYEVEDTVLLMLIGANRETTAFDFLSIRKQQNLPKLLQNLQNFEKTATYKLNGQEADIKLTTHATALLEAAQKFDISTAINELRKTSEVLRNIQKSIVMTFLFMQDKRPIKGSIELDYAFPYYVCETDTTICVVLHVKMVDDQLYIETHLHGKMKSLTHASLQITATEYGEQSSINTVLTATTNRGNCIGKNIVARIMDRLMCKQLTDLVQQGQDMANAGLGPTPAIMTKQFIENISKNGLRE